MTIRVSKVVLVLLFAFIAGCQTGTTQTPNSPTPAPTATPITVARAVEALGVPQTSFVIRTVEATPIVSATATITTESVPDQGKEEEISAVPNPKSSSAKSGLNEVSGAVLTVYNCIGENGGYCPERSQTASGAPVAPGVAACDRRFMGKRFVIDGDPANMVWTCRDTGLFVSPLFDLWFYDLAVGRDYINKLPAPYVIVFVD